MGCQGGNGAKQASKEVAFFNGYVLPSKNLPCRISGGSLAPNDRVFDCSGFFATDAGRVLGEQGLAVKCPCRHYLGLIPKAPWNLLWQLPWEAVRLDGQKLVRFKDGESFWHCEEAEILAVAACVLFEMRASVALCAGVKPYAEVFSAKNAINSHQKHAVRFFESATRALRLVYSNSTLSLSWSSLKNSYLSASGMHVTEFENRRAEILGLLCPELHVVLVLSDLSIRLAGTGAKENLAFGMFLDDLYNADVKLSVVSSYSLFSPRPFSAQLSPKKERVFENAPAHAHESESESESQSGNNSERWAERERAVRQRDSSGRLRIRTRVRMGEGEHDLGSVGRGDAADAIRSDGLSSRSLQSCLNQSQFDRLLRMLLQNS